MNKIDLIIFNKQKIWRTWCISYWSNANVIEWNEKILFHKYGDSQCKVLSFVSLIVRTLWFHSRSLSTLKCKFQFICVNKNILHGKYLSDFYSHGAMHQKTQSLAALALSFVYLMHRYSWIILVIDNSYMFQFRTSQIHEISFLNWQTVICMGYTVRNIGTNIYIRTQLNGFILRFIVFLEGTVTNPAIWLVLYPVSIFLSRPTGHGNTFVSRRVRPKFRCHFS